METSPPRNLSPLWPIGEAARRDSPPDLKIPAHGAPGVPPRVTDAAQADADAGSRSARTHCSVLPAPSAATGHGDESE